MPNDVHLHSKLSDATVKKIKCHDNSTYKFQDKSAITVA